MAIRYSIYRVLLHALRDKMYSNYHTVHYIYLNISTIFDIVLYSMLYSICLLVHACLIQLDFLSSKLLRVLSNRKYPDTETAYSCTVQFCTVELYHVLYSYVMYCRVISCTVDCRFISCTVELYHVL